MAKSTAAPAPAAAGPSTPRLPPFAPVAPTSPSPLSTASEHWVTPFLAPAYFPLSAFLSVARELTLHPERNSALILRADPLGTGGGAGGHAGTGADWAGAPPEGTRLGLELADDVRVRLMPRQPKRDRALDQRTTFFRSPQGGKGLEQALVLKVPLVRTAEDVPWFHPPVRKLAFHWRALNDGASVCGQDGIDDGMQDGGQHDGGDGDGADDDDAAHAHGHAQEQLGTISVSYLAFPEGVRSNAGVDTLGVPVKAPRKRSPLAGSDAAPAAETEVSAPVGQADAAAGAKDAESSTSAAERDEAAGYRLERTCLALLERLYKFGAGTYNGYQKRVHHDIVVAREPFQDLYLVLKDRHRHLESRAQRPGSTPKLEDVKRHVWKNPGLPDDPTLPTDLTHWGSQDVAIAAFLMLLWKDMYPAREAASGSGGVEEWERWGRPPGGFIDLGCGNGLLVHILVSEGYEGVGYELRQRRTWPLYPPKTRAALVERAIDMPAWFPETMDEWEAGIWPGKDACAIKDDSYLIGNHSDELTPWLPLLSLLPAKPVPHLSLPCCLHKLDSVWTAATFRPPPHAHALAAGFDDGLEDGASRYKAYVMWLGHCGLLCGWQWEKEALRIPSTRGWAIVARKRWTTEQEDRECRAYALEQVNGVRQRGAFKVRVKEGKEH
ncbi:tRNA(Ser) Um(44) 2'-O-methyltransferase [Cryptotrichosporon argae]